MDEGSDQAISKSFWRRQGLAQVINLDGATFHAEKYNRFFYQMPRDHGDISMPPCQWKPNACPKGKKDIWGMENGLVFFLFSRNVLMFVFFGQMYLGIVLAWLLDQLIGRSQKSE